jgi:outer membrane cobalamin receptor
LVSKHFKKVLLLANYFWLLVAAASAQDMERDTMALEGVEVFAPALDKYAQGQTVRAVSKENLEEFQGQDLGSLLQQRSGIFVRQHGPGMIASVTMRGTSAGHTAVFWNGLPINSPSLGQLDFSLVPVNGIDAATIHHGTQVHVVGYRRVNDVHQILPSGSTSSLSWSCRAEFAAITELGIAVQLTAPTFLIILGAVALAAAIAFGFGAQGVAREIVEKAYERTDEAQQKMQQ